MALIYADRVKEITPTYGTTDTIEVTGAVSGYRTFGSVCPVGSTFYYCIDGGSATGEWETGIGTMLTTTTFRRATIASSSMNMAVEFTPGSKDVYLTVTAASISKLTVQQTQTILSQNEGVNINATTIFNVYEAGAASNSDVVPTMSSASAPSGTVSGTASTVSTYDQWKMYDKSSATYYWSQSTASKIITMQYKFAVAKRIVAYSVNSVAFPDYSIKSWLFQGSGDGVSWTTLDQQTGVLIWTSINTYMVAAPATYQYYRIITSDIYHTNTVKVTAIALLSPDSTSTSSICPVLSSNTSAGSAFILNMSTTSAAAYKAFDSLTDATVLANVVQFANTVISGLNGYFWLSMSFPSPKMVGAITLSTSTYGSGNIESWCPIIWKIQGSFDAITWVDLYSHNSSMNYTNWTTQGLTDEVNIWKATPSRTFPIATPVGYRHYRWYCTKAGQNAGAIGTPGVVEIALLQAGTYTTMIPYTDYRIDKAFQSGEQSILITRLKAGTSILHTVDYI